MEIGSDVIVGFEGPLWGIWEEEEDSLFNEGSSLTEIFQPIVALNAGYASSAKTDFRHCSRHAFAVATRGTWSASVGGGKDSDGNGKATADAKIGTETDSGVNFSAQAGGSVSSDKDQNLRGTAQGSVSIERKTESGINISINAGGYVSKDKGQNTQKGVQGSVSLNGNF